jgi:DNA primase
VEQYLKQRGLSYATACAYELGVGKDIRATKHRRRLLYPILEFGVGEIVGYQGRILPGDPEEADQPKAWHDVKNTGRHLFGFWQAMQMLREIGGPMYIVEGPMDAMVAAQQGYPTVAKLGTSLSRDQARLIACVTNEIVEIADSGVYGQDGSIRSCKTAWDVGLNPKIAYCPPGEDPATLAERLPSVIRTAVSWRP